MIEQTIGQKLPKGFQRAEFLLEHGFVDKIVKREEQRIVLADILRLHQDKVLNNAQSDNTDIKNEFKSDNQESMKTVEEDNRILAGLRPIRRFHSLGTCPACQSQNTPYRKGLHRSAF